MLSAVRIQSSLRKEQWASLRYRWLRMSQTNGHMLTVLDRASLLRRIIKAAATETSSPGDGQYVHALRMPHHERVDPLYSQSSIDLLLRCAVERR